jgi:hypothetical protein
MLKCAQKLLDTADIVRDAMFHQLRNSLVWPVRIASGLPTTRQDIRNLFG